MTRRNHDVIRRNIANLKVRAPWHYQRSKITHDRPQLNAYSPTSDDTRQIDSRFVQVSQTSRPFIVIATYYPNEITNYNNFIDRYCEFLEGGKFIEN